LMPAIKTRYRTTNETAIMGESLAGLFVVETLLLEPALFDSYIAFDPSLWWNDSALVKTARPRLAASGARKLSVYLASSDEPELKRLAEQFADVLKQGAFRNITWYYQPMPEEKHSTIYHPAALRALRTLFALPASK
ncbi:MAG TPA: alpha/beta hydrolase-fold protein, partial [Longimicrobiales bacterium]